MKRFFLPCLVAALAIPVSAATQFSARKASIDPKASMLKSSREQVLSKKSIAKGVQVLTVRTADGSIAKRLNASLPGNSVNPLLKKAPAKAAADGYAYQEDFEGWDGADHSWLPEGVSLRHDSDREEALGWEVAAEPEFMGTVGGLTGNCMTINYDIEYLDEWVVLPAVDVKEDMVLSFDIINDAFWYFSTDNVDWETYEYIGDKVKMSDQQVMASVDGGENWSMIKSFADEASDMNAIELMYDMTSSLRHYNVPVGEFEGKKVIFAFRYVGNDGNLSVLDNVALGYPELQVSYMPPFGTYYFGMSAESYTLNYSILAGPVFKPMTFENSTYNYSAEYAWEYMNADSEWAVSDDQDYLEVSYRTNYSTPFTTRNNLYYTPVLKGSASGYTPGEYQRGQYLQAGGRGEFELKDRETGIAQVYQFGLGVIDPVNEGMTVFTDRLTPIFGYDPNVDAYWTEYTFGNDVDEGDGVVMDAYFNYFYNNEFPIVIDGVHASAFAKVSDGVQFKAEIVPLTDEGAPGEPIAEAVCGYDGLTIVETDNSTDFITLNFKFDAPVVMSYDECFAYIVRISGFHDPEHVSYFNPIISESDHPDEFALGWIQKQITFGQQSRPSFSPVVNYTGGYNAFYIMLDATFPWLEGEDTVTLPENGIGSVTLDSSVDGAELSFEGLPEWLTASAEGIHGNTVVTFVATPAEEEKENVVITAVAPGVSHEIKVITDNVVTGIESVGAIEGSSEVYSLSGVRVADFSAPGVYIVRSADGKTRKVNITK